MQLAFSKHKKDNDLVAMIDAFTAREQLDGYSCENCKGKFNVKIANSDCYKQVQFVEYIRSCVVIYIPLIEPKLLSAATSIQCSHTSTAKR